MSRNEIIFTYNILVYANACFEHQKSNFMRTTTILKAII